jgi:ribosomal protein L37AE/L43A
MIELRNYFWSSFRICRILNDQQINRRSKSGIWRKETVRYILSNEAYIGDSLWRKKYTANQFPFQKRENHGEIPQYYCKNHHPAIVNEATFEAAQRLIAEKSYSREKPEKYPLTCKIECADCTAKWMRCVRRGKVYWVCRKHKERAADCAMKPVSEQAFFNAFLRFFHKLKQNYNHIFPPLFPSCKP